MAAADRVNPLMVVQFPFGGGIDEASRDEIIEPGQGWAVLENGRQNHRGGYSTRNGFTALSSARTDGTASAGYKLFSDGSTPVRVSDLLQVESYSSQAGTWKQLGRVCEADYRTIELPTFGNGSSTFINGATAEDVEYCNGYLAVVTLGSAYTSLTLLDAATKAPVLTPGQFGANTIRPLLASYGGRYIAHLSCTTSTLTLYFCDTQNLALGFNAAFSNVTTTAYSNRHVAICSLGDRVAVAYINNSGGASRVTVNTYDVSGLLETASINTNSVTPNGVDLGCYQGTGTLWVAWNETTAVKMRGLTYNSLATVLATTATVITLATSTETIGISPSSATAGKIVCNDGTAPDIRIQTRGYTTSAGAAASSGSQIAIHNVTHCSRPFYFGSRHYVQAFGGGDDNALDAGNTQKNLILVDWTDASAILRPVVNLTPELAVSAYYGKSKTVVGATSTTLYGLAGVTRSNQGNACTLIEYDFASARRWQTAAVGNSTTLGGGVLSTFDGTRCAEVGFMHRPRAPLFVSSTGVGSINGTYRYVCVYEDIDADANWHLSGLSSPSAVVTATNDTTITMTATPLSITSRAQTGTAITSVRIAWYRTLAGAVAPYYRVGTSFNDPSSATITFADTMTDATAATKAKLYGQPGVLGTSQDHRPPPGLGLVVSYNGMLVGATGSDVWYSAQNIQGEGSWFNPLFQVPIPGEGDITALFVMDGTLFVAKRREMYAINGEPPVDNASSGGLGFPRRLSVDVGAVSHVTCSTAFGTFFQSERGIEIMNRSQAVEWVGEGVQDKLTEYPLVTAMTVDPRSSCVLIEVAEGSTAGLVTGDGRTLVYDLSLRSWQSTDRRTSSTGTADTPAQSGCMVYTGTAWRYGWIGANGVVYIESDSHLDAGYWIAKRAVTGHIKTGGIQGLQHVNKTLLLGKRHTSHDVSMSFAYNYADTYETARLYTATEIDALAALIPNVQLEHPMHEQARCEAVRVQLADATPSTGETVGTGQAGTWVALAFEVVPQQGAFPLPDEAK